MADDVRQPEPEDEGVTEGNITTAVVPALRLFRRLCDRYRPLGCKLLDIEYSGYGDSGDVDDIILIGPNDDELPLAQDTRREISDIAWELVPLGFENNEGGRGNIRLAIQERRVTLEHYDFSSEDNDVEEDTVATIGNSEYVSGGGGKDDEAELGAAMDWLAEEGVLTVRVDYSGRGDEGFTDDIGYDPEPSVEIPEWVNAAVEVAAYDQAPGGYENNEGGHGSVYVDLTARTMRVEHYDSYIDEAGYELSWDLTDPRLDPADDVDGSLSGE